VATHVYFTSALPPEGVYHNLAQGDSLAQLTRRCEVVEMFAETVIWAHLA